MQSAKTALKTYFLNEIKHLQRFIWNGALQFTQECDIRTLPAHAGPRGCGHLFPHACIQDEGRNKWP